MMSIKIWNFVRKTGQYLKIFYDAGHIKPIDLWKSGHFS